MTKKNLQLFAIGHAHMDPVWQWNKAEGYQEVFATFRSALDRLTEFPQVYFLASSAQFYEWVAESDPAMFAEIKQRVKEGRWIIVGGWWVEADVNCPHGEALVRQGLYAQHFFKKYFDQFITVAFSPDTFGHPWTLPQILTKQGFTCYMYMRPESHEKSTIPAPVFNWEGIDGTQIPAISIIKSYNAHENDIEERLNDYEQVFGEKLPLMDKAVVLYGVGNHGGGPTIRTIEKIEKLRETTFPNLIHKSLLEYTQFVTAQKDNIPVLKDDLLHHARGCYSACAAVKKWDRHTTNQLLTAEKLASLSSLCSLYQYPVEDFKKAWKFVLFNQFHDILAGSSIEEAYVQAGNEYGFVQTVAQETMFKSYRLMISQINTYSKEYPLSMPFVVFNPHACSLETYIEYESEILFPQETGIEFMSLRNAPCVIDRDSITLRDAEGNIVPYQILPTAAAKQENGKARIRILFNAKIPGFGYHVYRLDFQKNDLPEQNNGLFVTEKSLENNFVKIEFDEKTGAILSFIDKVNNKSALNELASLPVVLEDWDDTWGHRIISYDQELGNFSNAQFRILEQGPELCRLEVKSFWGNSFITQVFSLYQNSAELHCDFLVDWHEKYKVLKLSFPTGITDGTCTYSVPYGFKERNMTGEEEPGQSWVDVSTKTGAEQYGVAVINDSKCGYSVKQGDIRITILHSTAWSHHNPLQVTDADSCRFMEQGIHEFAYKIVPHIGDWRRAQIPVKAEVFLQPPVIQNASNQKARLEPKKSFIETDLQNISISVVKMAEDRYGFVLRCVELYGMDSEGYIKIIDINRTVNLKMSSCEIKTIFIPFENNLDIQELNLIEDQI